MAVINDPTVAANISRVGSVTYVPQHVVSGPFEVGAGGAYKLAMLSGTIAAALGASSEIFQFRYVTGASRVCRVQAVRIGMALLTLPVASTTIASGPYGFRATVARAWTVAGSGGTRAVLTGNLQKLRTSHNTSEVNDAGISTTGALTAGTKTLDTQDIGAAVASLMFATAAGAGTSRLFEKLDLFGGHTEGMSYPLVLANQEGFVIRTNLAMPATATWTFTAEVIWSEVDAF